MTVICVLGFLIGLPAGWLIASRLHARSLRRWQAYADEVTPTLKLLAELQVGEPSAADAGRLRQRAQVALILHPDSAPVLLDAAPAAPRPVRADRVIN